MVNRPWKVFGSWTRGVKFQEIDTNDYIAFVKCASRKRHQWQNYLTNRHILHNNCKYGTKDLVIIVIPSFIMCKTLTKDLVRVRLNWSLIELVPMGTFANVMWTSWSMSTLHLRIMTQSCCEHVYSLRFIHLF